MRGPVGRLMAAGSIPQKTFLASDSATIGGMKTTVDIPDDELKDVLKFTGAATKREAIVTAIAEFNRRRRMAALTTHAGQAGSLMSVEDLQRLRRRR